MFEIKFDYEKFNKYFDISRAEKNYDTEEGWFINSEFCEAYDVDRFVEENNPEDEEIKEFKYYRNFNMSLAYVKDWYGYVTGTVDLGTFDKDIFDYLAEGVRFLDIEERFDELGWDSTGYIRLYRLPAFVGVSNSGCDYVLYVTQKSDGKTFIISPVPLVFGNLNINQIG